MLSEDESQHDACTMDGVGEAWYSACCGLNGDVERRNDLTEAAVMKCHTLQLHEPQLNST
jgi:hypothetical protein